MTDPADDDTPVTEAELEAAQRRHDAERPELAAAELFARAVTGDGFRGDVPIGADDDGDPSDLEGQQVTAKRLGWDDADDAESELDAEPYAEKGYASPDLSGELSLVHFPGGVACLVGGQEADLNTVRPA